MAVVHSLVPTHPEWAGRLNRAVEAFHAGEVDAIIVTGGRCFYGGKEVYNNPLLMRNYLNAHGVPSERILWRDVADDEVETERNPVDSADEVSVALSLIQENEWQSAVIRPVSNWLHLIRIRAIYWWRGWRLGMSLKIRPLAISNLLGWKWAVVEVGLFWPYTLLDPGWTGPLAEKMRESRRRGGGFGVAGGDSSGNA